MMLLEPLYRKVKERFIPGKATVAFFHSSHHYYISDVIVFQDGTIYCYRPMSLDEFKAAVRSGEIVAQLPEGASLGIRPGTQVIASQVANVVEDEEFIKEVEDLIRELRGEETTVQRCRRSFGEYLASPTNRARQSLHEAYEQVPKHRRMFIGGMASQDSEVRSALGLDESSD